jgi:hypothetical protein
MGETPFSGSVPICAEIEIGSNREKVDVKLKYNKKVTHTYKMQEQYNSYDYSNNYSNRSSQNNSNTRDSYDYSNNSSQNNSNTRNSNRWLFGFGIGGGVSLNMNDLDPNYFKSWRGQFNTTFGRKLNFFGLGFNLDYSVGGGADRDAIRREYPDIGSISDYNIKINTFAKLSPVNFLFLSGGVGWAWFGVSSDNIYIVDISTPIFPVGGGMCLESEGECLFVIETLYNIVPFKGRTAAYISINARVGNL